MVKGLSVVHSVDNTSDHEPVNISFEFDVTVLVGSQRNYDSKLAWHKASSVDINNYCNCVSDLLSNVTIPVDAINCKDVCCNNCLHRTALNQYCRDIGQCCLNAGLQTIPTTVCDNDHRVIPGWSEHVAPLREKSLFWHNVWLQAGKPRNGVLANIMRTARINYHKAIRNARKNGDLIRKEKFADKILENNSRDFWHEVKKMRGKGGNLPSVVDDCKSDEDIAECFANKYKDLYSSVPYNVDDVTAMKHTLDEDAKQAGDDKDAVITVSEVYNAIHRLHTGKSDGTAGLMSDHFVNAGSELCVHISMLLTGLLSHGFVPDDLLVSTIIPIPKAANGKLSDSDNYRGICLSSIVCKIIDIIILQRYIDKLSTSELQFGFKAGRSTNMCTMLAKEVLSYYTHNSSSVYCTLLDAKKAFDRVNYCKLFNLLNDRKLPAVIVRFLLTMYTGHSTKVVWNGSNSDNFCVRNGVKQGGILSPILFCVYIDNLLVRLSNCGKGCFIGNVCLAVLAYADDLIILAPTPNAMRHLLSICDDFAENFDIKFNAVKSKCIYYPPSCVTHNHVASVRPIFYIGGNPIDYVEKWSHLGHILHESNTDSNDIINRRNALIRQANDVICYFGKLDAIVKCRLLYSYCSSLYGCELWKLGSPEIDAVGVSWRKALKRVWGLPFRTHSDILYAVCGKWSIEDEVCRRSIRFISSCLESDCKIINYVVNFGLNSGPAMSAMCSNVLYSCAKYNLNVADFYNHCKINKLTNNSVFRLQHDVCNCRLAQSELNLLLELIFIRDGVFNLGTFFDRQQLIDFIHCLTTS
jgi:hypothetical protein